MADALDLLAASLLKDQSGYQTQDPFYSAGVGIDQVLATAPAYHMKPWQAALAGVLGGFGSGLLKGIGTASADKKAASVTDKLTQALAAAPEDRADLFKQTPELSKYGSLMAVQDVQDKNEALKEKKKMIADLLLKPPTRDVQTPQGITLQEQRTIDPETGALSWEQYGQGQSPGQRKLQEALAEKAVGNTLYGDGFDPEKTAAIEDAMRKELKGGISVEQFQKGETAFQNMIKAYPDTAGASDLDFLYGSIQTREPGMAVRKDDQDLIRAANGLGGVFADAAGYLASNRKFTPDMRKAMLDSAARARDARIDAMNTDFQTARGIAERRKINPDNVLPFALPERSDPLVQKAIAGGPPPPNMSFEEFKRWKNAQK